MKKIALLLIMVLFSGTTPVMAVPYLQLDTSDGIYNNGDETIYATTNPFTLFALVNGTSEFYTPGTTYYISAAITPKLAEGATLANAYFEFDGSHIDVTEDMIFGAPPILDVDKELQSHGIFDTYYAEFAFTLDAGKKAAEYNTQDNPGGLTSAPDGTLFYEDFLVSVFLPEGYGVHFDLYTLTFDGKKTGIDQFAPFSHDAQSSTAPVPEPASLLLLATGLIGVAGFGRKKFGRV